MHHARAVADRADAAPLDNFIDLQTAIELFTPVYQLFLTDNDFWRATNSLQLDETIGLYVATLLGSRRPRAAQQQASAGADIDLARGLPAGAARAVDRDAARAAGALQAGAGSGPLRAAQAIVAPMKNMCTMIPVANEIGTKRHLFGVADSCITTRFMTQ